MMFAAVPPGRGGQGLPDEIRPDLRDIDGQRRCCCQPHRLLGTNIQSTAMRGAEMNPGRGAAPAATRLHELLITLDGAHVRIDRRVLVPGQATLRDLHVVIQLAMGWEDCHLHAFTDRSGTSYGDLTMTDLDFDDESSVRVSQLLAERGDELVYEYDFGDSWRHRVELVQVLLDDGQGIGGLACIGGHGRCPPEDCGGVWSYAELCDTLANPRRRDHEEMVEWMRGIQEAEFEPSRFDPSGFDLEAANEAVRGLLGRG